MEEMNIERNIHNENEEFAPESARKAWKKAYWSEGLEGEEITLLHDFEVANGMHAITVFKVQKRFFWGNWEELGNQNVMGLLVTTRDYDAMKKTHRTVRC